MGGIIECIGCKSVKMIYMCGYTYLIVILEIVKRQVDWRRGGLKILIFVTLA